MERAPIVRRAERPEEAWASGPGPPRCWPRTRPSASVPRSLCVQPLPGADLQPCPGGPDSASGVSSGCGRPPGGGGICPGPGEGGGQVTASPEGASGRGLMTTSERETWRPESRKRQVRATLFNCPCRGGGGRSVTCGMTRGERAAARRRGRRAPRPLTPELSAPSLERGRREQGISGSVSRESCTWDGWRKTCGAVTMQTCE